MAGQFFSDLKTDDLADATKSGSVGNGQVPAADSEHMGDFATIMNSAFDLENKAREASGKINLEQNDVKNGLGQLVLTLVRLLHELLERQALRRIEAGSLTDTEIENIGVTLMRQAEEIERLRKEFGLEEKDLNLDLGPLGKLL